MSAVGRCECGQPKRLRARGCDACIESEGGQGSAAYEVLAALRLAGPMTIAQMASYLGRETGRRSTGLLTTQRQIIRMRHRGAVRPVGRQGQSRLYAAA